MINLNKALTILSRDGATATVLDAGGNTLDAVAISANGVTLGGAKKGFTITDADGNGVTISNGLAHVAVIGNRTIANTGDGVLISDGTASNLVSGNISLGNNIGFEVHGANHSVVGNAAPASTRDGFRVEGNSSLLTGNIASDNGFYGVNVISNSSAAIVQNSVLSNTRFGILINSNSTATIKQNNIFGNNEKAVAAFGTNGVTNCGVANASAGTLTLSGNYFGAATGPGVDPADKIVNFLGSSTTNTSFAIKEIKLKPITP
jgi:nitrous oxidase accessory protein NosD